MFCLLPSLAWGAETQDYARMNPYILGGGVSAATCSLWTSSTDGSPLDGNLGDVDSRSLRGQEVNDSVSSCICKVSFYDHHYKVYK
jgi:hypothetical protein